MSSTTTTTTTTNPQSDNGYMYGSQNGLPVDVTQGGNVATSELYERKVNVGKMVLRTGTVYQLPDCPCVKVTLYTWASNKGNIWLGGITTQAAQVGAGLPIPANTKLSLECTNSNYWTITPDFDADNISITIDATAEANNVNIAPQNPPSIDSTPPEIVSTIPTDGTTGQATNTVISFQTNILLDQTTVTTTNITVSPAIAGGYVVTQDSTNPFNILILYTPPLADTTIYDIQVANLKNTFGFAMIDTEHFSFQTSTTPTPPDMTPPTLIAETPLPSATAVDIAVQPTLSFDKPIAPISVTTTSIELTNVDTTSFVTGSTFSQSTDLQTITMSPPANLDYSTNYRIDVFNTNSTGNGIQDTNGAYLDQTYSIPFKTEDAPPPPPPPYTIRYNVAGNGNYINLGLWAGGAVFAGENFNTGTAMSGKIPVYFVFTLRQQASSTLSGTVSFVWKRQSKSGYTNFKTIGTMAASAVSGIDTQYTFSIPSNTDAIQSGDAIGIQWESGNSTNKLQTPYSTTNAFDSTKSYYYEILYNASGDVVQSVTGADFAMTIGTSN